ncbi:SusC/RagA family TonB-linked outer membrane protein [Bacteroides sp.]|uniref:SusC/RagA family TonB-linked outer membrane protein n=1 Tax=Bacteroides sp. TaxID=29523 RepID=UPI00262BDC5B|nr:SusC/RagA family TonB-linked outer membrane protein [Bacteroides sp.]
MKKRIILTLVCLIATIGWVTAQNSPIKGIVISAEDNEPIIGASVLVKGTTSGIVTDLEGNFVIADAPKNATTLQISYVGMMTQEVPITPGFIKVILKSDTELLDEVVVTALGIAKKEKSLTYSTQVVNGDELTRAKDPNMMNALAGKTAGVQINKSSSGLGGSSKVVIRGNRSVSGSNQPLYVIDGVPFGSSANENTSTTIGGDNDSGNYDRGDGISNLNPDDIESMNILKGPAAAALYGSSAANGVVIITTKKGKEGRASITFNSSTTIDNAAYGIPEFQNHYTGTGQSWGGKINGSPDYADEFFRSGVTTINSLSMSMGSEAMQTYFSYANTYGKGVVDNNSLVKHNLNFRETANFLNNKLTVDANINGMYQRGNNRVTSGGYYLNPLVGLYHFPRGGVEGGNDFYYYRDNYQSLNPARNMMDQNWYQNASGGGDFEQNPYWLVNKTPNEDVRYRAMFNLSLKYKFNDLFSLQARGSADFVSDKNETHMYAGTGSILAGVNGRYIYGEETKLNTYGDVLFTYQQQFKKFSVNASVGGSVTDYTGRGTGFDSYPGTLSIPNVFVMGNVDVNGGLPDDWKTHTQSQSVFFTGQVGFMDQLYLDVTARNDWTSTLAYTKYKDKGFFYPSIGLTWLLNETLKLPEWIDLGKIRGAWSQVGNGLSEYISHPLNSISKNGNVNFNTTAPFDELKPERTTSIEFGTEWRFFNSRLEFDFTYYKTNTKDQLFNLPAPSGSAYERYYVNAGEIQNQGVEIMLNATPVMTNNFRWKTGFNFATNKNKALELVEGLDRFLFNGGESNYVWSYLEVGGSFGDIYGTTFKRDDNGQIQYAPKKDNQEDDERMPLVNKDPVKLGNSNPDFNLGWSNTITWKDFSLYFLIDGRFGGDVMSLTEADLDQYGVSKASGDARDRGYIMLEGRKISGGKNNQNIQEYYKIVGGRSGVTDQYMYDATNIRLRELSIAYTLPQSLLAKTGFIKGLQISFIGRNLFFFKNNAPYDPDGLMSTSNRLQGVDVFGMPTNRSFGFNLKVNF